VKTSISPINLITVTGPTAGGKTKFGAHLAKLLDSEIISADSRQVYKQMNLGTGKDYDDYTINGTSIPYHLIDKYEPGYKYNVYEFQQDFIEVYEEIRARKKIPLLVGGTGLYIEAVTKGYKLISVPINDKLRIELDSKELPELVSILESKKSTLHNSTDTKNKKRTVRAIEIAMYLEEHDQTETYFPKINQLVFGIKYDRASQRKQITQRLKDRLACGLIEEVAELLKKVKPEDLIYYGLEYKFITLYLTGKMSLSEMTEKLEIAIHQFAKRQITWFRKIEREGTNIHWIDGHTSIDEKINHAVQILAQNGINVPLDGE